MTHHLATDQQLLTWLDVERVFKHSTQLARQMPVGITEVNCYYDGVDLYHHCSETQVFSILQGLFGKLVQYNDARQLYLQLKIGQSHYPIHLHAVDDQASTKTLPLYPLWRDITYLSAQPTSTTAFPLPAPLPNGPDLIAFHSFKGGVGRTTALMTYLTATLFSPHSTKPRKVLVIDADMEAPGVTFWLDETNRPHVSFLHFLEAMNYPPSTIEDSLDFFAEELKKTAMLVDGSTRELFVLPAALNLADLQDMPVQPSHLSRNLDNPWQLSDYLHRLGQRLEVDAVFIDLRAGLSEFSSPIIFDPRIKHYFVTTVAKQSVSGICEILQRLHNFNAHLPVSEQHDTKPSVIISLLTPTLRNLPVYPQAKECIEAAYPPIDSDQTGGLDEGVEWIEADFNPSLMAISSIKEAFPLLQHSQLYQSAIEWARNLEPAKPAYQREAQSSPAHLSLNADAQKLNAVCEQQYAEQAKTDDSLVTEPLRNLVRHYSKDIPNAIIIGAKGAGKTFTYLQVCQSQTWAKYIHYLQEPEPEKNGSPQRLIVPILWSRNLQGESREVLKKAQSHALKALQQPDAPLSLTEIARDIEANLQSSDLHWDDFWEQLIVRSLGYSNHTLSTLSQHLHTTQQSVVLLFDGLEDVFKKPNEQAQSKAIESLLTLVNRLSEITEQTIGTLIFARIDYVQATITQNLGQFMARFSPFELKWNAESFLRLAYWLCGRAGIIDAKPNLAATLTAQELITALEKLWGAKLGRVNSREAQSARWVFAALCDLTGQFQARDLVRFLRAAAELSASDSRESWKDRILTPESMRKAIPRCSEEKVQEAILEISPLESWSQRMANENVTERTIPFSAHAVHMNTEELSALRKLGIVYEDSDSTLGDHRLFLPEIYRAGLKFELSGGGRPRIQALLRKNLGKLPF